LQSSLNIPEYDYCWSDITCTLWAMAHEYGTLVVWWFMWENLSAIRESCLNVISK